MYTESTVLLSLAVQVMLWWLPDTHDSPPFGEVTCTVGAALSIVVKRHVSLVTVRLPSFTVTYQSYCAAGLRPGHDTDAGEPDGTTCVAIGANGAPPPMS